MGLQDEMSAAASSNGTRKSPPPRWARLPLGRKRVGRSRGGPPRAPHSLWSPTSSRGPALAPQSRRRDLCHRAWTGGSERASHCLGPHSQQGSRPCLGSCRPAGPAWALGCSDGEGKVPPGRDPCAGVSHSPQRRRPRSQGKNWGGGRGAEPRVPAPTGSHTHAPAARHGLRFPAAPSRGPGGGASRHTVTPTQEPGRWMDESIRSRGHSRRHGTGTHGGRGQQGWGRRRWGACWHREGTLQPCGEGRFPGPSPRAPRVSLSLWGRASTAPEQRSETSPLGPRLKPPGTQTWGVSVPKRGRHGPPPGLVQSR